MMIEIIIQELREKLQIFLSTLEEETGMERHRLSEIEQNKVTDKILFVEMLMIANALGKGIEELFAIKNVEIR